MVGLDILLSITLIICAILYTVFYLQQKKKQKSTRSMEVVGFFISMLAVLVFVITFFLNMPLPL